MKTSSAPSAAISWMLGADVNTGETPSGVEDRLATILLKSQAKGKGPEMGNNQSNEDPLGVKKMLDRFLDGMSGLASGPNLVSDPTADGTIVRLECTTREGARRIVIGFLNEGVWEFTGSPFRFCTIDCFMESVKDWELDRMFVFEEAGTVDPTSEAENAPETGEQPEPCTCITCEMRRSLWGRN